MNLLHAVQTLGLILAQNVPPVGPSFDSPLTPTLVKAINIGLGIIILIMSILFFVALVKIVMSFTGRRSEGTGNAVGMMVGSLIVILLTFGGAATINGWVNVLR